MDKVGCNPDVCITNKRRWRECIRSQCLLCLSLEGERSCYRRLIWSLYVCPASLGIVGYCVYVSLAIVRKFACACACTITLWGLIGSSCLCKGYLEVLHLCLVCVVCFVLVYAFVFVFMWVRYCFENMLLCLDMSRIWPQCSLEWLCVRKLFRVWSSFLSIALWELCLCALNVCLALSRCACSCILTVHSVHTKQLFLGQIEDIIMSNSI